MPRVLGKLLRALFEHGVIKFRKTARHYCGVVFAVWKKNRGQRFIIDALIPNTAFEGAGSGHGLMYVQVRFCVSEGLFLGW